MYFIFAISPIFYDFMLTRLDEYFFFADGAILYQNRISIKKYWYKVHLIYTLHRYAEELYSPY